MKGELDFVEGKRPTSFKSGSPEGELSAKLTEEG